MIKSREDINRIREVKKADLEIRRSKDAAPTQAGGRMHILVCGGTGCTSSSSMKIIEKMEALIAKNNMADEIKVIKTGCFGLCAQGPIMMIYPDHLMYTQVQPEDVEEIFENHVKCGQVVTRLLAGSHEGEEISNALESVDFFSRQMRVALRNCGAINPEDIDEYIARDGYLALEKVITEMTPEEVIELIKASGLRGRGGAGFPTGVKWSFAAAQQISQKYVCCNADEGDPGAFMDRSVLEGDPHSVIEAMAIAAYAIGWNLLKFKKPSPVFRYVNEGEFVYFVHSFYAAECDEAVTAVTEYGAEITAAVAEGNVLGCQFHPEKSGRTGLAILKAFCEL